MHRRRMTRIGALAAAGLGAAALALNATGAFAEAPEPEGDMETKIVGGDVAAEGQFPWMVSLTWVEGAEHYCGGTLIEDDLVLTAGHCLDDVAASDIEVRHGAVAHAETEAYAVEDWIVAAGYDHDLEYDWAVVKLAEPVPDAEILPLATADDDDWTEFQVAGWGVQGHTPTSPDLRWAEVPYIDDAACGDLAESQEWAFYPETQLCAGVLEPGAEVNACPADSGGPLMAEVDGETVLAGLVSFGSDCFAEPDAGVYASVGAHIDDLAIAVAQLSVNE
ncbi:S1 family peptidase [Glycomyces niveus]|uniref:Serine protease n=1 Tax=Glycomyces niveus TaxID=2820287 RepID=A0ABS3U635_9ACTN|nr:serine protease [Glycomyces sp. NEAU-S30]MBO3734235.1 serine protease [Glycomyces sp. NEAU-S30]